MPSYDSGNLLEGNINGVQKEITGPFQVIAFLRYVISLILLPQLSAE